MAQAKSKPEATLDYILTVLSDAKAFEPDWAKTAESTGLANAKSAMKMRKLVGDYGFVMENNKVLGRKDKGDGPGVVVGQQGLKRKAEEELEGVQKRKDPDQGRPVDLKASMMGVSGKGLGAGKCQDFRGSIR